LKIPPSRYIIYTYFGGIMSSIVKVKSGKYTYLYESESYRDENGVPRNRRKCVGRVDPKTGKDVFNSEYLERVWGTDKQPTIDDQTLFSVSDVRESSNKEYGVSYLFEQISESIGLSSALNAALPESWGKVLTLAFYMTASGDSVMYCENWLEKTESLACGDLSSQRISELLLSITNSDRMEFYEKWGETQREHEYFTFDITSISSYSELINRCMGL
jgi:hypothetical protein